MMRSLTLTAGVLALATIGLRAQPAATTPQQAQQLVRDAYVFAYPLVTMEYTRRQTTNVAKPDPQHAPLGQFLNMRAYPTADFRAVTAPNADTLYSAAFLDLSQEPYVFEQPALGKRFFLMPMLDAWTNVFADPGSRTTGEQAQTFLITGPGWSGVVPSGMKQLKSPTNLAWILGRTYSDGTPQDYKAVHAIQDKYKLTPLSAYASGKPYTPPAGQVDPSIDMKTPPRDQVNALSGKEYFTLVAKLLKANPPASADAPMVAKLAKIGIVPGQDFDPSKLDPAIAAAIDRAPKDAVAALEQGISKLGKNVNGWQVTMAGEYGTDYFFRAVVAYAGLGANLAKDAVYPTAKTDAEGHPLDTSQNNYVLTFANKDALPPVKGFWSLTLYNDQYFFYKNPLNRQTRSQRDKLVANKDGSIDIYIQNQAPPKDKQANWLPAPKGPIVLMMRLYWPSETPPSILDGSWQPPAIKTQPLAQAQR